MGKENVHFSSKFMRWETDPELWKKLNKEFKFGLDAAASAKNALCERFITEEEDALKQDWARRSRGRPVYCNPPYGRGLRRWVDKGCQEGEKVTVVMLTPARPDTQWFEIAAEGEVRFLPGRLGFWKNGKPYRILNAKTGKRVIAKAPFPSMITVFRPGQEPSMSLWYWRSEA